LRATIEVLATQADEVPPTTKRKKKKYRLRPDRPKRSDLLKVVPLE
jgi:hypothetical protein